MAMIYCYECGQKYSDKADKCPKCFAPNKTAKNKKEGKTWTVAFLLCFFLGLFGAHRFYLNKNGTAVTMLLLSIFVIGLPVTLVWYWIDFIILLVHAGDNDYIESIVNGK